MLDRLQTNRSAVGRARRRRSPVAEKPLIRPVQSGHWERAISCSYSSVIGTARGSWPDGGLHFSPSAGWGPRRKAHRTAAGRRGDRVVARAGGSRVTRDDTPRARRKPGEKRRARHAPPLALPRAAECRDSKEVPRCRASGRHASSGRRATTPAAGAGSRSARRRRSRPRRRRAGAAPPSPNCALRARCRPG